MTFPPLFDFLGNLTVPLKDRQIFYSAIWPLIEQQPYREMDIHKNISEIVKELFKEESTYHLGLIFEISLFSWIKKKTNVN